MLSWRRPRFVDESPECESAQTIRVGSQFEGFNSLGHLHPGGSKWVSNFIDLNRFVCILLSSSFSKVIFFKYFKFILKLILQLRGRNALNWTKCALFSTVFGGSQISMLRAFGFCQENTNWHWFHSRGAAGVQLRGSSGGGKIIKLSLALDIRLLVVLFFIPGNKIMGLSGIRCGGHLSQHKCACGWYRGLPVRPE